MITNLRMELFQALLFTREDDSPASHHEAALPALEEAGDDEGLVGAAGHDTDVQTHARLASDNWPLAARHQLISGEYTISLHTILQQRMCPLWPSCDHTHSASPHLAAYQRVSPIKFSLIKGVSQHQH